MLTMFSILCKVQLKPKTIVMEAHLSRVTWLHQEKQSGKRARCRGAGKNL